VEKKLLATPAIQLLKPFSYLLTEQAKKKEIGKALAVVSNALKQKQILVMRKRSLTIPFLLNNIVEFL